MTEADEAWEDEPESQTKTVDLSVIAAPCEDVGDEGCTCSVVVTVEVPEGLERTTSGNTHLSRTISGRAARPPTDVCCIVDISGSMNQKATYEVDGVQKDDGLTYLDIVKHAVKTVMHIMKDQDRLSLIAFDHKAYVSHPLSYMTESGRTEAVAALEALRPQGATNIWEGLHAGMESLNVPAAEAGWRQKTILLLTDGQPNREPPKGHIPELRDYKESHPDFSFQLNTFGFGYNLNSQLLLDLAKEGQGTFAFIPDAIIVGTCFVNCVANLLSTQTQDLTMHLTPQGGAEFAEEGVIGVPADMVTEATWGRVVSLGPLTYGQSRDVVVPLKIPPGTTPYLEATVEYPTPGGGEATKVTAKFTTRSKTSHAVAGVARSEMVSAGYKALEKGVNKDANGGREDVLALGTRIESWEESSGQNETITALKTDVQGRMAKALEGQDRFERWGRHYLRALIRAHQLQFCTNFMDVGLQVYGGSLFKALRGEGDDIFMTLPPPKPSAAPARTAAPSSTSTSTGPDMSTYYAGGGGA